MRFFILSLFLLLACGRAQSTPFAMAAQAALDREFAAPAISYLLLDGEGLILAQRWPDGEQTPVSPGSLLKPWLALAYGEQHGGSFPSVNCQGTSSYCWLPRGHGKLELQQAIAVSCNAYFLQLANGLERTRARETLARYNLQGPTSNTADSSLIGLGDAWKESPLSLARAYLRLASERNHSTPALLLRGMHDSAAHGTAKALGEALGENAVFAKTGTAACSHHPGASGDGFTVVLYPATQPRLLLLVRVHGVNGATSSITAASMLRTLGVTP